MQFKLEEDDLTIKYAYKKLREAAGLIDFKYGLFKVENTDISNLLCDVVYMHIYKLENRNRLDLNIKRIVAEAKEAGTHILESFHICFVPRFFFFKRKALYIRFIKIEGVEYGG